MSVEQNENQAGKRYYWMKLRDNFFGELTTIAMRKLPDGDAICLVYLKLMLHAIKSDGQIHYEGIFESLEAELSAMLGEDEEIVRRCIEAMVKFGLAVREGDDLFIVAIDKLVGSESSSAKRMRESRARKAASEQCAKGTAQCDADVCECDTEIEKREEKDIDTEVREKSESGTKNSSRFTPPTLEEVKAYCEERKNNIDPVRWLDYYTTNGFMVGKVHMKDWRASVRLWERSEGEKPKAEVIDYSSPGGYAGCAW